MTQGIRRDRRELLCFGLAGLCSLPGFRPAAGQDAPPGFSTRQSQFIEMSPAADVAGVEFLRQDGTPQRLGHYAGRAVLLNFWASWCPPCRRELPILAKMQSLYAKEKFTIVPIALDRDPGTAKKFLVRIGLPKLFTLFDPAGSIATADGDLSRAPFPLFGMPISYIMNLRAKRTGYFIGEADWSDPAAIQLLRYFGKN